MNVLRDSARRDQIETRARTKLGLPLDLAAEDGYDNVEERLSPRHALSDLRRLPANDASTKLLSLRAQHPEAAVDDNPADYAAAQQRLWLKIR